MVDNTAINSLRIPELTDPADITDAVGQLAADVDTRLFARFATPAARDAAITSPISGMACFIDSYNLPMIYYTSYWGFFPGTPVALLYASAAQALTSGVGTAILLNSEEFDTLSGPSTTTNTSRYNPNVPGRYQLYGGLTFEEWSTGTRTSAFRRNGSTFLRGPQIAVHTAPDEIASVGSMSFVSMNGTSDYIELMGLQTAGVSLNTVVSSEQLQPSITVYYMGSA